jgi:hypothetical protein
VGEDVVELSEGTIDVGNVEGVQVDAVTANRGGRRAALRDLPWGQIDPDEAGGRQRLRHRQQVEARAATELQHPATGQWRWFQPAQCRDHRQIARVGMIKREIS